MPRNSFQSSPELDEILRRSGNQANRADALAATRELALALQEPLRKGVLAGDILDGIYETVELAPGAVPQFPLDLLAPGTERNFVAYTVPNQGRIPERHVEADYVMIPTYEIAAAIDWLLRFARDARWDVVGRAMEVLQGSFVKKMNDDGWHTILAAGVDRNILVYDSDANAGQFTKRLVSLMKTVMRRNGGGNSTSLNRGILTDLYLSPECIEDVRNWGVDLIDEFTRREIYVNEGAVTRIFQVNLHEIDELGQSQEYENFFLNQLSGSIQGSDVELLVGLDLRNTDSFISPVRQPVEIVEDDSLHRQRRSGLYGSAELGFAALDNRRVILGSC